MSTGNIILLIIVGALAYGVFLYNRLVALRQETRNAFADIDVQLRQRYDLIPNLMATVQGAATHEASTLLEVAEARSNAMKANTPAERGQAESALTTALGHVFALAESYPALKANENFLRMQADLGDIENKIAAARRFYNNAVAEYNTAIEQIPASLFAGSLGFKPAEGFGLSESERATVSEAPKVKFD
jgi:LemA protein